MPHTTPSLNVEISAANSIKIATASTAIVAVAATSPDADDIYFPENQPILVTNYETAISKAGTGEFGTLKNNLEIFAQVSAPLLVVVRVPCDAEGDAIEAAIIAALGQLIHCNQLFGFTPDYIGAPGLENANVDNKLDQMGVKLDAAPYAAIYADDLSAAIAFNNTLTGSGKLKTCWPDFIGFKGYAATMMLAMRAFITSQDNELYGPHKTIGNVPLPLVTGLTELVVFDPSGKSGDVKALNEAGITTMVYFDGAWRFWGDEMRGGEGRQQFENVLLVDLWMKKTLQKAELKNISMGLTKSFVKNVISDAEKHYRTAKSKNWFIGYKVEYREDKNPVAALGAGKFVISASHTVPSPAGTGLIQIESNAEFYSALAKDIAA